MSNIIDQPYIANILLSKPYERFCEYVREAAEMLYGPQAKRDTYTYFVSDGEFIKIGVAKDISKRVKGLQTGHPKEMILVQYLDFESKGEAHAAEKILHCAFHDKRMCGEWFDIANDRRFLRFIKKIRHREGRT